MKRLTAVVAIISAFGWFAHAEGPTVYGMVNKELRSFSETLGLDTRDTALKFNDVNGAETRLGVKGNGEVDALKYSYQIEMGLNSNREKANEEEKIRMRQAWAKVGGFWGSVLMGQTDVPYVARINAIDPLANTVAALNSGNIENITNGSAWSLSGVGVGFAYRTRVDQVTYTTPVFYGVQYSLTQDTDNRDSTNTKTTTNTMTSHTLSYDEDFGMMKLAATLGVWGESHDDTFNRPAITGTVDVKRTGNQLGVKMDFGTFAVGLGFGNETVAENATAPLGDKIARTMVTAQYKILDNVGVAATYGKATLGDHYDSQTAVGGYYNIDKNFTLDLTMSNYTIFRKGGGLTTVAGKTTEETNTGKYVALGMLVKF